MAKAPSKRGGTKKPTKRQGAKNWPDPQPLETDHALPPFPTDALPTWLRAWVEAQSHALQVPSDLPALLALSAISTACARRFEVKIRQGWIEPVNLYVLVALASGTRKSVVFEAATAPIVAFELEQARRMSAIESIANEAAQDGRLRLVVDGDVKTKGRVRARTPTTEADSAWRVFVSDATPERVASLLAENGGRAAILSDEGEICSIIAGRYGGSFEVFLKAHSGQVLTIERQGRPRVHVRRPALTLGLAVQPDVLSSLAAKRAVRERGLLARFLVAVPASNVGFRKIAPPAVSEDTIAAYAERFRTLLERDDRRDADGELSSTQLGFSRSAHEAFTKFEAEIEDMLRPDGKLGAVASWGSKLPGAVARIAGLLMLAEHGDETRAEIDRATVGRAIAIGRYCIEHALTAFDRAGTKSDIADARVILEWISRAKVREVTKRDLHQALRSQFPRARDLDEPLRVLVERGYLRARRDALSVGRPSQRFEVHARLGAEGF